MTKRATKSKSPGRPRTIGGSPSATYGPGDDFWYSNSAPSKWGPSESTPIEESRRLSAVYACVRVIAETIASLPLHLYKLGADDSKEKAKGTDLYEILHDQPNPWQSAFEWRDMLSTHLLYYGNAICHKYVGPDGRIAGLIPRNPTKCTIYQLTSGKLQYVFDLADGTKEVLSQGEILHVRGPTEDGIVGLSPISICRRTISTAMSVETHADKTFENGAQIRGVLKYTGGRLDDEAFRRLRESWNETYTGSSNAGKMAILEDGLEWQAIGMSSVDAEFLAQRRYQIADICRIFRVPPYMVGEMVESKYNSAEQMSLDFVKYTIGPWVARWEQALYRDVIFDRSRRAEFAVDGLLRGDIATRFASYAIGIQNGIMSPNEARRFENMNPIEGGDIHLSPANMVPLGSNPSAPTTKGPVDTRRHIVDPNDSEREPDYMPVPQIDSARRHWANDLAARIVNFEAKGRSIGEMVEYSLKVVKPYADAYRLDAAVIVAEAGSPLLGDTERAGRWVALLMGE